MDIADINKMIRGIKLEHKNRELSSSEMYANPFQLFMDWFGELLSTAKNDDPCAMVVSTVDENNIPDSRVVLLKEIRNNQFIFYSNYNSKKAKQLAHNNAVAINFYWPEYERQVRIKGTVEKVDRQTSEAYFLSRPRESQLSAQAWIQSSVIADREEMDERLKIVTEKYAGKEIPCPSYWGGYAVTPFEYEFFQAQKWRRHDRLLYQLVQNTWSMVRLAP